MQQVNGQTTAGPGEKAVQVWHITAGGERGGAKTHILSLLPRLDRDRFAVRLVCLNDGPLAAEGAALGLAVTVIPMPRAWNLGAIQGLARLLRQERVAIVHTHGVRANLCGRVAARLAGVSRVVTTVHSLVSLDYHTRMHNWLSSRVDRLTLSLTHRFVAVSEALGRNLVQQGIPAGEITVIANGLETSAIDSVPAGAVAAVRAELGLTPGDPVVGAVGRLVPVKAYDDFLRASALVSRSKPGVRFMLIGDGPCDRELQELARSLGLGDRVIFTGFRRDIPALLHCLTVFVLSSHSEGLPLVLLEAMAAGKPVVSTAVGGVPEVVTDGVNGLLTAAQCPAELAAAIGRLLDDGGLARRLGEAGREQVRQSFSVERMVAATEVLYLGLLAQ